MALPAFFSKSALTAFCFGDDVARLGQWADYADNNYAATSPVGKRRPNILGLYDLHGNVSQPIRWTAYVQQNTLKWEKDSVVIRKIYGDDTSFDVNITNRGGTVEYYTLKNLPQWLTLAGSELTPYRSFSSFLA